MIRHAFPARLGFWLLVASLFAPHWTYAEIDLISTASHVRHCNDTEIPAKVARKISRLPVCAVSPAGAMPACPPGSHQIALVLWGDDEPVVRAIEVRVYRYSGSGELLNRWSRRARQEDGRLVARMELPRLEAGERLEATFVLPRRVRRLEPGDCLWLYANPSRWVTP